MIVVDSHCHALPHWFEPVEVLLHEMDANGVQKAVLIQVRGQFDNSYLIECLRRFPGRFCAVAGVDTGKPDAPETLARWVDEAGDPRERLRSTDEFTSRLFEEVLTELPNLPIIIEHLGRIGRDEAPAYPRFRKILALARASHAIPPANALRKHPSVHGDGLRGLRRQPRHVGKRFSASRRA